MMRKQDSGGRRETLINLAFLSVSLPLWKDVFHDLGFYSGPDDAFADVPSVNNLNGTDENVAIFAGGCFWSGRDPYTQNTWQNKADVKFGGKEKAFEAIFK
ncbi:unnamed protein product [Bathycoccus prasinos]